MSPDAAIAELSSLTERIDELSTRLLIEGVQALATEDFLPLAQAAREQQNEPLALACDALADSLKSPRKKSARAQLHTRVSHGLEHLRTLLDNPPAPASKQPAAPRAAISPAAEPASLAADEDLIREFITESGEHLVNIEGQMLILERNAGDGESIETLNAVFRAFHTIKGLAGFLEFGSIQALAHEVETLLDLARNGKLLVTPAVVDVVLESTDVMRRELASIELRLAGKTPPPSGVDEALLQRIRDVSEGEPETALPLALEIEPSLKSVDLAPAQPSPAQPSPAQPLLNPLSATAVSSAPAALPEPAVPKPAQPAPAAARPAEAAKPADSASVRIDTGKLDQLMDMVGEMVIAQTLIGHSPALATVTDARLLSDLTQLARITADVQRITTGMRMVPIGLQFQKTARVIRDLSRRAGKQIVFETSGEDTEVDKTIAEEISDPLLHMVRNSIDHGIETPAERIALGKDPTAHIRLAAYHQSGQIVISISDDGRGLNREKILAKAIERGLVQPGANLTDSEVFLLIFEAGFSTAEKVTDISGRGVGMDVVRRHVQALRGRIDIQSKQGVGTTFFLKLPLTLAIIEGLVIVVGDQRYIAPIFSVKEMFRPTADMLSTVQGVSEMVMVRGGLLPIIRLHRRFNKQPRTTVLTEGTLIVAEAEGHQFCLFVDDLVGKQEVVIKSLGQRFAHVVGIAGCAILGDGRVGLILDMHGIFKGKI
jgi:two-component system chemotaxis sensor kinase CheA